MNKPASTPIKMRMITRSYGRCLTTALALWLIAGFSSPALPAQGASQPIKTLIVTGQNYHNSKETSAALKQMLENTGLFDVLIAVSPPAGAPMKNFRPDFSAYSLVVLDYSGDPWPRSTQVAFAEFVKKGGGVVVTHSANNAFPDWPEYNAIIGLGGWGNRNEKNGPYVYWKDKRVVRDAQPGIAGTHTDPHAFLIITRDKTHPVTAGLPEKWMHADDELYGLLRGPGKNMTILATAYSDPEKAGTGRHEPVLFTVHYGSGRVFHTVLGHAAGNGPYPALECVGFITTFQRGAEWAATGRVTQKVPGDFPATERDLSTPADARRWPGYQPPSLDATLEAVAGFEHSKNEEVIYQLREYILAHKDSPESRAEIELKLLAFLETGAPAAAKMEICRHLRLIGSEKSIPVLERMLVEESTTDMARYALEKIRGEAADRVFIKALSQTQGPARIGVISSLGERKCPAAVAGLGRLLEDQDKLTAAAAAEALAEIGGQEATKLLLEAFDKSRGNFQEVLATGLLKCAEQAADSKNFEQASSLYEKVFASDLPPVFRRAGLRGKILISANEEARRLILDTLRAGPQDMHEPVIGLVQGFFDASTITALCGLLMNLPGRSQVGLLSVLEYFPAKSVLPVILEAAKSRDFSARLAALRALGKTGDSSTVSFLAERGASTRGLEQEAARASLLSLAGESVDETIRLLILASPSDAVRNEVIRATADRRMHSGKPLLFQQVRSASLENRRQAARALRQLAEREDLPSLLDLLLAMDDDSLTEEMMRTVVASCRKIPDPAERAQAVKERLAPGPKSKQERVEDPAKRCLLYRLLGQIASDSSLPLLRTALADESAEIRDAAVRTLADWPTPTPRHDLLLIAGHSSSLVHQVLAVRGYVRMIGLEKYQSPQGAVKALESALEVAKRPDEIKLVLGALPEFACPEALKLAESFLDVEEVKEEAQAAAEAIKHQLLPASSRLTRNSPSR